MYPSSLYPYLSGSYFSEGRRYMTTLDRALDGIVAKFAGNQQTLFDVIEYEYSDWRMSRQIGDTNRDYDRGTVKTSSDRQRAGSERAE